jgi:hypothetical protein
VEFYMDGILVGQSSQAPYGVVWASRAGKHVLSVTATDRAGNTAEVKLTFTVGK